MSTAIQSCRSSTILCSGDQISARSAPAYRVARTLGTSRLTGRGPRPSHGGRCRPRCRCATGRRRSVIGGDARRTPWRGRRPTSAPTAVTASTRPPAVTSVAVVASAVPAWMTSTSRLGRLGAGDHVALAARTRGSPRWPSRPRPRRPCFHRGGSTSCRRPSAAAMSSAAERRVEQGEQRLGLGVAEAGVELDHPDAARGQREAGVEQAGEGGAAAGHLVDGRLQHALEDLGDQVVRRPRAAACRRPCRRCSGPRRRRRSA